MKLLRMVTGTNLIHISKIKCLSLFLTYILPFRIRLFFLRLDSMRCLVFIAVIIIIIIIIIVHCFVLFCFQFSPTSLYGLSIIFESEKYVFA